MNAKLLLFLKTIFKLVQHAQKMNHIVPLIHKVTTTLGVGGIKREENWTTYPIPI